MKKITISIFLLFFSGLLLSQSISVNTTTYSISQLVQNVLIDSPCAQVSNFTSQGNCGIGYFSYGGSPANFPFQDGVIIRCGIATNSAGNYSNSNLSSACPGATGDSQLLAISQANGNSGSINDASFVKFNFTPFTDNFSFNFIFASNEYGTYQCTFGDVFAFILTDITAGTPSQNLAVIPGTTTPVSVTSIRNNAYNTACPSVNPSYFSVFTPNVTPASNTVMNMRGYTVPMTASATVIPNHNYTIKLVIGDYNDTAFDSAVFIEGGSFNVGVANLTYPIGLGGAYTQDMLVSNGQAVCPGQTRVISTGLNAANFDFVWTKNGVNLNIDAPSITVSSPGTYCVSASVTGGGACSQTDCIVVEYFTGFPINQTPPDMVVCSSPANLTIQNLPILAGLDPNIHDVQYYYSMADAQAENNPITAPIAITLGATIPIVARVTNIFAACPEYATFNVTYINNNTVAAASSTPTICQNTPLIAITHATTGATGIGTATGLPAGVTATWASNTITISGTPTVSGTFNYSIPLTGGCGTITATGTINVTPGYTVSPASSTPTLCSTTTLIPITHTTTGASGIGIAVGLPTGVSATWTSNTVTISGTPSVTGTFNYSIPLTGGCGTISATGTITVISINTVAPGTTNPSFCLNSPILPITHTTGGATGIGTATGLPAGVTATWVADTITISGTPTVSGTFIYSIPLTGGCGTINATGTLVVIMDNTVTSASSLPSLCTNVALTPITHTTTGATGIGTPTGLPAGVTAAWAANTITISGTPTASGIFNYSIPLTGGCGSINAIGTITVTTANTVTPATYTPILCLNTILTPITHTTTGATGIGNATSLPTGVTALWSANTIIISGTPTGSGIFNYSIPLTGGCGGIATGTITVTADNTVTAASATPTLCINTALTAAITHTTTGATGIGTPTGLPAGVTATWATNTITINGTPTASGTFAYTIPLTGGCGTVNATGTITVTPNNTVTAPSATPILCVNTALLAAITHTTTGATGIASTTTNYGLPAGVTATWSSDTITINGTPTASGIFNYSIPLAGGCGGTATGTITVTPDNTVTAATSTPTLCINTVLTAITHSTTGATGIGNPTGLPTGVTATWSANIITISGTPSVSGTFAYMIPLTGGCGTFNATGTITVNPDNTVSPPSTTPTICINTALPAAITHTTTGATGIGTPTGLPAGVTATWAANIITISGTPTASGIFNYSIPLTGGCGTFNATGTITVSPSNTVTTGATTTLCINTVLPVLTHTTTGATGIGTPTGLPAGVTASWAANTITISGTPTASGTFAYTIPLIGGCDTVNATGTITVTPNNTVTPGATTTLCINTVLTSITHTTTGATGIGTPTGLPAGVTATWAANTITISGTPTVSGTFAYTIPLTGGCGTVNATGTITVNVDNTVSLPTSTPTVCINTPLTAITHTTTVATGIGTPTGLPAGVTATWAANTITISGTPTASGTFAYTIPLTGGCGTVNATGTITVTPDNTVTPALATPTLCINTALPAAITHTTTGATGIGTTTTNYGLPTGVTATWAANTITINGTPTASGTFAYTIPLTGGCGTVNATGTITVTPDNTVTAATSTPTLCINTALVAAITHTTTGATGIGTPAGLPAGVTATWAANTITINGTPTASGTFAYTIPLTGGCGTVNATGTITVTPNNTVTAPSATPILCVNTALVAAITHTTTGATGIGTPTGLPAGVTATWLADTITINGTPTASGIFNYSIPLAGGCGGTATGTITVTPDNTVTVATSTPTLCINTVLTAITHTTTGATGIATTTTNYGLPTGVTASWLADTITISGTPSVSGTFAYTIPLTGGCGTVNATGTITVTADNTVTAPSATPTICINTALTAITHTTTGATGIGAAINLPAGVTASWAADTITISGTPTAFGAFNYSIPLTGGCGTFTAIGTITVIPSNTVTAATSTPTLCVNTLLTPITHNTTGATGIGTATGLPAGVTASWLADTITLSGTPTTIGIFNYTIPLTGGCGMVNATGTITVNPAPANISITGTTTTCAGIPVNVTLTATPGTQLTWNGTPSTITIGASGSNVISVSPAATTSYEIVSADLNGCAIPVTGQIATVTVSATPQFINQIADVEICNGGTLNIASLLTSTVAGADFIWSATTSNVNMAAISGNQANIDQVVTLINGFQNGTINIEVKPQIGSCSGTSQQILITVKPVPVITSTVSNKTVICNNEFVTLTSNSNPAATVYNWQINTATGVQIVGGATSGTSTTGIVNLQLALTNPLVAGTISFDFTPVNGICTGATITNAVTITVNPIPGTPIGLPINEICSEESTNLTISSFPSITGTTLVWTVIDSQNVTGFTNGTGTAPFTINDVLTNTSDVQGFVKYSVTSRLGNCDGGTTEFIVRVNPLPKPVLIDGHICVNQATGVTYQGYVLDAQLSDPNFTYDWYLLNTTTNVYDALPSTNGPTYEATLPGTYQVVVTNTVTNCEQSDTASVVSVFPATGVTAEVTDAFTEDATITVTVNPLGTGNLIYSLDGGAWQESNIFTDVQGGTHEVMVEDTEGCTNLTIDVLVIDYPKYFTPNGDGIHDTWKIIGLEAKHNAKIYIFDRYGKLMNQMDPLGEGWNGKFNGEDLPSTDYWFTIDYKEKDQQKLFKAHFSLKR
jgi:gliding motility-associated-like protein